MRISDWSSDVCSSDLGQLAGDRFVQATLRAQQRGELGDEERVAVRGVGDRAGDVITDAVTARLQERADVGGRERCDVQRPARSEARREGKEWVSTCRSRWSPAPTNKQDKKKQS